MLVPADDAVGKSLNVWRLGLAGENGHLLALPTWLPWCTVLVHHVRPAMTVCIAANPEQQGQER